METPNDPVTITRGELAAYQEARAEVEALRHENADMAEALSWIRIKLGLTADAGMFAQGGIAGMLHVWESGNNGYQRYITAHKCDDKQGEIARQSVKIADLEATNAKQRAALELCIEIAEAAHCFFSHDHGDISNHEILAMYIADETRFDKALVDYASNREAVMETLKP